MNQSNTPQPPVVFADLDMTIPEVRNVDVTDDGAILFLDGAVIRLPLLVVEKIVHAYDDEQKATQAAPLRAV